MPPSTSLSAVATSQGEPTRPRRRGRRRALLAAAAALAALLAFLGWRAWSSRPAPLTAADVDRRVQAALERSQQDRNAAPPDATTAYRTIAPSLVTIRTPPAADNATSSAAPATAGLGAGVIINAEGAILTALHVVEGSQQIEVQFADGTEAAARIATSEPKTDIAVLAVDRLPEVVVPAVMGGPPPVGDAVFAVGHPLGLAASLTAGVVSFNDRSIRTDAGVTLDDLIQFDAAVNPGNSGGPLLNRGGQVVGIVTSLANPSKQPFFVGVGFAVPIATAGGAAGGPQQ